MNSNLFFANVKSVLFIIFFGVSFSFYANTHTQKKSYFNHLSEINKEWKHHKEVAPKGMISFNSDLDRIQLHLNLVIAHLKTNSPSGLNPNQLSNRLHLLDQLQDYADKKVFPINKYHAVRTPYFVDYLGTNCAVGQMIYVSGHEDLVVKISKEHNYDYLKDIHTEGILEWAVEFGFTLEELKWIQPAYQPTRTMEQILGGTNGKVTQIELNTLNGDISIAGDFTELDNSPCLNFGYYKDNQLSCYGNGIDGKINDVFHSTDGIFVFGAFNHHGEVYPIAKFDGANWSYISIPGRIGAVASAAFPEGLNHKFKVVISHSSIPNHQEVWHYLHNNTWEKQAMVNGVINDIEASGYGRVHAGHFDSVIVYNANATIDTTFSVNNVVIHSHHTDAWHGIDGEISDTVNTVIVVGDALIFGGTCGYETEDNKVCISRYYNSVLQPLFLNQSMSENFSINTLNYGYENKIVFGGEFHLDFFIGTYGDNLATYNLTSNAVEPIAILDEPVNSVLYWDKQLYVGGEFQNNMGNSVNYLGKITSTVGLEENNTAIPLNVYPNPFHSIINLEGIEDGAKYSILYIDGSVVKSGIVEQERIKDLEGLPNGSYLLQIESQKGNVVKKVFK